MKRRNFPLAALVSRLAALDRFTHPFLVPMRSTLVDLIIDEDERRTERGIPSVLDNNHKADVAKGE